MPLPLPELHPYLTYATPPLLGAFIGYLTNRVAIRMLFRPLRQWRLGPVRIPMTPGVIPSKRHDLALNIGEMVGEHLLTSEEINNSLKKEAFQEHLYALIESKVGSFLKQDLGPLPSLVPATYKSYFDIGYKTALYQIKETIHRHLQSEKFTVAIEQALDQWLDSLLSREINEIVSLEDRAVFYDFFERNIGRLFGSPAMDRWAAAFIDGKVRETLDHDKSLQDVLPESLCRLLIDAIRNQTPHLLEKGAEILHEPEIREKLIVTVRKAIEEFIASLGPMAAMVSGFLNMKTVEEKIRDYLTEKEGEITGWLTNDEVQDRVAATLVERAAVLLQTPLARLAERFDEEEIASFSAELSHQLVALLREPQTVRLIAIMLRDNIETHLDHGARVSGDLAREFLGGGGLDTLRKWLKAEAVSVSRSANTRSALDRIVEGLLDELMQKPVGRLANIIPAGVRDGLYRSLQEMATRMLISEVPGIVKSLNIKQIVSDRIDSFDLLRLEKLLLSIMEDQFKYINLFGGLLGFLIGCANLIVLVGR